MVCTCSANSIRTALLSMPHRRRRLGFDEIRSAAELCTAAAKGNCGLIRGYIRAGINVDAADYDKRTALHIAAADGNLEVVRRSARPPFFAPADTLAAEEIPPWQRKGASPRPWQPSQASFLAERASEQVSFLWAVQDEHDAHFPSIYADTQGEQHATGRSSFVPSSLLPRTCMMALGCCALELSRQLLHGTGRRGPP